MLRLQKDHLSEESKNARPRFTEIYYPYFFFLKKDTIQLHHFLVQGYRIDLNSMVQVTVISIYHQVKGLNLKMRNLIYEMFIIFQPAIPSTITRFEAPHN